MEVQALPGQTTPEGVPAFKLVLVGDGGTGTSGLYRRPMVSFCQHQIRYGFLTLLMTSMTHLLSDAGKTTFVKRHLTGEFEKKYERESCAHFGTTQEMHTIHLHLPQIFAGINPMSGDMSLSLQLP